MERTPQLSEREWLTVAEASELFRFPVSTFKKWAQRKLLNEKNGYCHFGRAVRINQKLFLEMFMNAHRPAARLAA